MYSHQNYASTQKKPGLWAASLFMGLELGLGLTWLGFTGASVSGFIVAGTGLAAVAGIMGFALPILMAVLLIPTLMIMIDGWQNRVKYNEGVMQEAEGVKPAVQALKAVVPVSVADSNQEQEQREEQDREVQQQEMREARVDDPRQEEHSASFASAFPPASAPEAEEVIDRTQPAKTLEELLDKFKALANINITNNIVNPIESILGRSTSILNRAPLAEIQTVFRKVITFISNEDNQNFTSLYTDSTPQANTNSIHDLAVDRRNLRIALEEHYVKIYQKRYCSNESQAFQGNYSFSALHKDVIAETGYYVDCLANLQALYGQRNEEGDAQKAGNCSMLINTLFAKGTPTCFQGEAAQKIVTKVGLLKQAAVSTASNTPREEGATTNADKTKPLTEAADNSPPRTITLG